MGFQINSPPLSYPLNCLENTPWKDSSQLVDIIYRKLVKGISGISFGFRGFQLSAGRNNGCMLEEKNNRKKVHFSINIVQQ